MAYNRKLQESVASWFFYAIHNFYLPVKLRTPTKVDIGSGGQSI